MKIEFNRNSLATAIGVVQAVLPSKNVKPILQNVLLEVIGGKATVTARDSEICIRHSVPDVASSGNASVLLSRRVGEVLRELRDDRVTMHVEDKKIQLCGERSKFNVPTENAADFPVYKTGDASDFHTMPGNLLKRMIKRTVFATDPTSARFALGGVLFDIKEKLSMVATDSSQLSLVTLAIDVSETAAKGLMSVVPEKALLLLERAIPDSADVVHLAFTHNQAVFTTERATITTQLVEGRFPRYQDVVPKSHEIAIDLLAGTLLGAIRQALIFTSVESHGVDFEFGGGQLKLVSQAAEAGDSEVAIPIGFDGATSVVRLNPHLVFEFLKSVPGDMQICLKVIDDESPVAITTDDGSVYLAMPLTREV